MLLEALLLSLSLCVDCFAVSACSSVSYGETSLGKISPIALVFGFVQAGLLVAGWLLGDVFLGLFGKVAKIVGFLLLLYVGLSMISEAVRSSGDESRDLHGLKNVVIASLATSIDALAVGASMSLSGGSTHDMWVNWAILFATTFLSVIAGMEIGGALSKRFGKTASIVGGLVLIAIGIFVLR